MSGKEEKYETDQICKCIKILEDSVLYTKVRVELLDDNYNKLGIIVMQTMGSILYIKHTELDDFIHKIDQMKCTKCGFVYRKENDFFNTLKFLIEGFYQKGYYIPI